MYKQIDRKKPSGTVGVEKKKLDLRKRVNRSKSTTKQVVVNS